MSSTRSPSSSSSNRGLYLVLGAVAAVVVAAFGVAVLVGGGDDADDDGQVQVAPISVAGSALPAFPEGPGVPDPATDPAVGLEAPTLAGVGFDETAVEVGADGTPRLVLFLAHWCPHCQREVPKIQDLVDGGSVPEGVEIVAVSTSVQSNQGNYPPSRWLADEGWTSPVIVDDEASSAARAFGLTGFPYGVYVDGDNRVVARTSGEVDPAVVQQLLGQLAEA
jgi:cytochrome c biogenesis protein CcmG, thiol:disulfide interchange protein DsbE